VSPPRLLLKLALVTKTIFSLGAAAETAMDMSNVAVAVMVDSLFM
jgi:hypothetical protein